MWGSQEHWTDVDINRTNIAKCCFTSYFSAFYVVETVLLYFWWKKYTLEQASKAQRGSRGIALLFLEPRHYMGLVVNASAPLPPGKTRYPLYRRLGGPQGRSGQVRKISPPTGILSLDRPARSESLYRLRYPGPLCIS